MNYNQHLSTVAAAALSKMSDEAKETFVFEFNKKHKTAGLAYLFWVLFGCHYAYLGRWGTQVLFWITGGGLLIWWLIDAFRMSGIVADFNRDLAGNIIKDMRLLS